MPAFDLDAYLARIRYDGPLEPDLATLAGLLAAHMDSIHFENIEVLLGRTIPLDVESLQEKMSAEGAAATASSRQRSSTPRFAPSNSRRHCARRA